MKFSTQWLQKYIKVKTKPADLAEQLTNAGLEVESISNDVLDVAVPANRADCLGVVGIAREVAALQGDAFVAPKITPVADKIKDQLKVHLDAPKACAKYCARIIKNIDNSKATPQWILDRLQECGVNGISPVVDITNYIMLEYGQPLHAFDLSKLQGDIHVRYAKAKERLLLLDDTEVELTAETLLIADSKHALAIAGIKGGKDSGIAANTKEILLECAYFEPIGIRLTSRSLGIKTDSSYRFERGIDPHMQEQMLQHLTQLIIDTVGGEPGPSIIAHEPKYLPQNPVVKLRLARLHKLLGVEIAAATAAKILQGLGCVVEINGAELQVTAPSFRTDITMEVDLIEEVARVYGLNNIPALTTISTLDFKPLPESRISDQAVINCLVNRGYNEVITYSFIASEDVTAFGGDLNTQVQLSNPISSEMGVMRPSLIPGLVKTIQYNQNRQQPRVRLFEIGLRYQGYAPEQQIKTLAGACYGPYAPETWANGKRTVDYYDLQGDVEALLSLSHKSQDLTLRSTKHAMLHPQQAAEILIQGKRLGYIGVLHPGIQKIYGLPDPVTVFELDYAAVANGNIPVFKEFSKFPSVRRDLAILIARDLVAHDLEEAIKQQVGTLLIDLVIFDVYQGKGIPEGQKSMALGITLQHLERTLIDSEVNEIFANVITMLQNKFKAILR